MKPLPFKSILRRSEGNRHVRSESPQCSTSSHKKTQILDLNTHKSVINWKFRHRDSDALSTSSLKNTRTRFSVTLPPRPEGKNDGINPPRPAPFTYDVHPPPMPPRPFLLNTTGTDWDLAQGIAPSPGGEGFHDIRSRGSSRRRGARMLSQTSINTTDDNNKKERKSSSTSSSSKGAPAVEGPDSAGGGDNGDGAAGANLSGRPLRPPINRSGSRIGTPARRVSAGRSRGRRSGNNSSSGGEDNSGGGHASLGASRAQTSASREGGEKSVGRGAAAGESDCYGFVGDMAPAYGKRAETQEKERAGGGAEPRDAYDDSDGESTFYGRSSSASGSAESMLLPAGARKGSRAGSSTAAVPTGGEDMLAPPSPAAY